MRNDLTAVCAAALFMAQIAPGQGSFSPGGANRFVQRKDWNGLVRYAKSWTASEPGSAMGWYYLGSAYGIGLHDPASARAPFEKAVELNRGWSLTWNALGFTYLDLKRHGDAIRAFQHCVDQEPRKSNYWNNLAFAYSANGRRDLAVQTLQRQRAAVAGYATYTDWYNMGNGFANLDHREEAVAAFNQALRLNPRFGAAWNNLGVTQQEMGNYSGALNSYRHAGQLGDPLGNANAAALQRGLNVAQQRAGAGRKPTAQMIREWVRQGQARAWETNHPGQMGNPHGRP